MALRTKSGTSFSGAWRGPMLLHEWVTTTGSPYVTKYARAKWSPAAFDAAYGELGE